MGLQEVIAGLSQKTEAGNIKQAELKNVSRIDNLRVLKSDPGHNRKLKKKSGILP